jgi:YidC/Oxa1 family membrane protein insertase
MDTQRLILFIVFSMSALFLWEAWQKEQHPAPPPSPATSAQPAAPSTAAKDVPAASAAKPPSEPAAPPTAGVSTAAPKGQPVVVTTDLYRAEIDTLGGVVTLVALDKHRDATDPAKPYLLLQRNAERTFVAQSGLIGEGMPNHQTPFTVLPGPRELASGADTLQLKLEAIATNGDKVVKVLTFHRGSYVIDVAFEVTNAGSAPITPEAYFQLMRDQKQAVAQSSMAPAAFVGPVVYNENDKFKKIEFSEIDKMAADPTRKSPYTKSADNGWVGMIEHYFVAAWLPPDKWTRQFYTAKLDGGVYSAPRARSPRVSTSGRRTRRQWRSLPRDSISSSTTGSSPSSPRRSSGCSSGCTASSATGAGRSSR